mgnify:FL=1
MVEVLVSVTVFSIVLLAVVSFLFAIRTSSSKTKADREAVENARRVLDVMAYEIKHAKSVYTSTTTSGQLSLETTKYLLNNEDHAFIDFFLCGSGICLKKESQNPVILTSDSIQVTSLVFTRILNGTIPSVKIDLTLSSSEASSSSSVNLTSTVSLRSN